MPTKPVQWWPCVGASPTLYTWRVRPWLTVVARTTGPGLVGRPPRWFWSAGVLGLGPHSYATHDEAKAAAEAFVRAEIAGTHAALTHPNTTKGATDSAAPPVSLNSHSR